MSGNDVKTSYIHNLILYLFNEDCQQPMATSGFPQAT